MNIGGTVAVITGGSSGIGRAMAVALAAEGLRALSIGDLDEAGAEETIRLVKATGNGTRAMFVRTDVTDEHQYSELLEETQAQFSRVDILCNNAGIGESEPGIFEDDADPAAWVRVVDINLTAVIRGTRLGVVKMRELGRGGVIVNTASMGGLRPMPTSPVYAATKAGVVNFSRSLKYLYEEANIRVNAICPSFIDTPLVQRAGAERVAAMTMQMPLLQPELVAKGLVELIFDETKAGAVMRITSQRGIDYARDIEP